MADHKITLNYNPTQDPHFKPDVDPVLVNKGDTISFHHGTAPPNTKFKITMDELLFSKREIEIFPNTPPIQILVRQDLEGRSTYRCQLIDLASNVVRDETKEQAGGGVEPHKKPGTGGG
jgi:hypothetical protein